MPRSSPFRIVLSRDEARELARRANKYTLPYYQVVRAKMILLAAEGLGNDEIAATPAYPARNRKPVAQALLRRTPGGLGGSGPPGPPPGFFPQTWSSRSRRWRVSCRRRWACRCRVSAWPMWRSRRDSSGLVAHHQRQHGLALAARGCDSPLAASLLDLSARSAVRMPRPGASSTCTSGAGKASRCETDEFVLSTDEKTSIQARARCHPTLPPAPGAAMRVEHEYERCGAWAYLAALDVHRAKVFGRCERTTGIAPFERLVDQVMSQPPYNEARRVFWIMDNGSSHRGARCVARLQARYPRLVPVHGPVHASWLNQIEIYFSIVAAQGAHAQRLRLAGSRRSATARVPGLLRGDRPTVRLDVHSARSYRSAQQAPSRSRFPAPSRCLIQKIRVRTYEPQYLATLIAE